MILNRHTIKGKKGETVCYALPNFRFDSSDNKLKWDAFRFYTPEGNQTDDHRIGRRYHGFRLHSC